MIYYQNENRSGEYDFRCNMHEGWQVDAHMHEYSELIYCKSGSGIVSINGRDLQLLPGHLIWLPPNYVHKYVFHEGNTVCAVFSNDFIPLYALTAGEQKLSVKAVDMQELCPLVEQLPMLSKSNRLQISGCLNLICAKVLEQTSFAEQNSSENVLYQKVISYISTHYTENITLESTANKFGYNPKYLSHALHSLTAVNFRELLAQYRINRAKELLVSHKEKSISEIAYDCGFTAQNTFNRTFKKAVGMTPFAFRNASHR